MKKIFMAAMIRLCRVRGYAQILAFMLVLIGWTALAAGEGPRARYVFLFIGDGMSLPQRTAAEIYKTNVVNPGLDGPRPRTTGLLMNSFPAQGIITTHSFNSIITDSAAAGTALATGRKTNNYALALGPDSKEKYTSMAKMAQARGRRVGLISSVSLDHATPAAFYAHQAHRGSYNSIARQLPLSGFDFFGGGGFKQPGQGPSGIMALLEQAGYRVVNSRESMKALKPGDLKVVAVNPELDGDQAMPFVVDAGPDVLSLADFVDKAIELLDGPEGFFMMVEGGKIDWASHANDAFSAIHEVLAFDEALGRAYEFLLEHPADTLIVVTADHETGGLALGQAGTRYNSFPALLGRQRGSYLAFTGRLNEMKQKGLLTPERLYPVIEDFFGLAPLSGRERKILERRAAEGDAGAGERLALSLNASELAEVQRAMSLSNLATAGLLDMDDDYSSRYGSFDPLTTVLTRILNQKAGLGWSTFSHSALPVPVSAVGAGAEAFAGYYDNTGVFHKIVALAGYDQETSEIAGQQADAEEPGLKPDDAPRLDPG